MDLLLCHLDYSYAYLQKCKLVALKFEISSPTYQEKGSYWISVTTFFCHHVDLDLCPVDKIQSNVSFPTSMLSSDLDGISDCLITRKVIGVIIV